MKMCRSISNIIAALGLIAVAVVAAVIGYTIIMNYVSKSFRPSYEISITYVKLVYITSSESIGGVDYTTFKGEIGVSNPDNPTTIRVCIMSSYYTSASVAATTFSSDNYSCPTIYVESGYNVYSFVIRIRNSDLNTIGCTYNRQNCPVTYNFYIVVFDSSGNVVDMKKPTYIVP